MEVNAKKIVSLIGKLKNDGMRKMLMMSKINQLSSSTDQKHADHIYGEFSSHLAHLIKMNKLGTTYKEYYYPMVKKSWIQNVTKNKTTQNPYAKNMRSCGSVKS